MTHTRYTIHDCAVYYRARYYDPTTGRFISEDEERVSGSSLYVYALNNPLRYVDPSGLSSVEYNDDTSTITLYSGDNFDGTVIAQGVAYNHPAPGSNGAFPEGVYPADSWHTYNAGDSDSGFGPYGNLVFTVPGRSGMSVHSGRANHTGGPCNCWSGPSYYTEGCIRTTDDFMKKMFDTQFMRLNSVKRIRVSRPGLDFPHPKGWTPKPLFWPPGAGNPR
jgi:RHS repeat-associated protein